MVGEEDHASFGRE